MYKKIFKRIIDLLLAILLLPIVLFIIIIFGPFIYFQDKGNIFYNSSRLGKEGSVFKMYKLRSMKINAPDYRNEDGSTFNSENDPRLLPIGKIIRKTSIDEVPQLFNVLKGDMSFIGPRPDLPEHKFSYNNYEAKKLKVYPGITGYNQAYFRNTIPWKERIKNDVYYVNNLSFLFDIKIFLKTIFTVLKSDDVYMKDSNYKNEKKRED